jgi:uncharacterized membrane protein
MAGTIQNHGHLALAEHPRLGQWSVALSAIVVAVLAVAFTIMGIAYQMNGDAGISDNWVGWTGAIAVLGGLAASLVAFAMAIVDRAKNDHWSLLWLPLSLFPALAAFLVLGEAFWWE